MEGKTEKNTGPTGALCELMTLDHRYNKNGLLVVVPSIEAPEDEPDKFTEYALVLRRIYNDKHELIQTKVDINSPQILGVLSQIVKYYPAHPERFQNLLVVEAPYMILYHHWDQLKSYRDNTEDDEVRMHLNFLLSFMDREMGEDSKKANNLIEAGKISFRFLWMIFRPGDLIVDRTNREHQRLWRLREVEYGEGRNGRYLDLDVACTGYEGGETGRQYACPNLRESAVGKGSLITKLDMYPLRFAKDQEQIVEKMIHRGNKYLSLRGIYVQRYKGYLQMLRRPPFNFFSAENRDYAGTFTPYHIEGRIIVDTKTFMEENHYHRQRVHLDNEDEETAGTVVPHTVEFWPSIDPKLCPPYVHGFVPSIKQWCTFYVDQITDPQWNPSRFNDLILPDAPKEVIRSLVSAHKYPEEGVRDQQELKGKGLVVLLHGTPGTGKTLAAESVSEYTKRPLVIISSGELGTQVSEIDHNLTAFLQYAAIWKAIVLIDEADVFLETRMTAVSNRLEQNSLVAVFLRQLEYFQGIVFLTTNRSLSLDPAIKSRIHLFLQFAPPDVKTRESLWKLHMKRTAPEEYDFDTAEALKLIRDVEMNGREISNAINTIRTLAREEGTKISLKHFKMFIQVYECFQGVEQEGKGHIGRDAKEMRKDTLPQACAECGCTCQNGPSRRGSLHDGPLMARQGSLFEGAMVTRQGSWLSPKKASGGLL